jgi:hypothetical protein
MSTTVIILIIVADLVLIGWLLVIREKQRFRRLAVERASESICSFVRSLDYRRLDTGIIRCVYEQLQRHLGAPVPLRASDRLDHDLHLDPEDLDDLAEAIALQCRRSLDSVQRNPYYDRVTTVGDLIEFLCAQPNAA